LERALKRRNGFAQAFADLRQLIGPKENERDDKNQQQFRPTQSEHNSSIENYQINLKQTELSQRQEYGFFALHKGLNSASISNNNFSNLICGAVSLLNPNYFWGTAFEERQLMKVGVFRNNGETMRPRVIPNDQILRAVRETNALSSSFPNDFVGNPVLILDSGHLHAGMTGESKFSVDG
jgi:hypothetical protein